MFKYLLIFSLVFISFGQFNFQSYLDLTGLVYYSSNQSDWDSLKTLGDTPNLLLADTTHKVMITDKKITFGTDTFFVSDTVITSPIIKRVVDEVSTEYGIIAVIYRYFTKVSELPDSVKVYITNQSIDTLETKTEIYY